MTDRAAWGRAAGRREAATRARWRREYDAADAAGCAAYLTTHAAALRASGTVIAMPDDEWEDGA